MSWLLTIADFFTRFSSLTAQQRSGLSGYPRVLFRTSLRPIHVAVSPAKVVASLPFQRLSSSVVSVGLCQFEKYTQSEIAGFYAFLI